MKLKHIFLSGCVCLLTACVATTSQTPAQWQAQRDNRQFEASGRLGVKINEKGSYANFDWSRKNGVETIDVNTPIGTTVGQLCQDSQGVLAQDSNGKVYLADTPEQLSEQLLGYDLPVKYLGVWANGEWVRDVPHSFTADGKLQQSGWKISRELTEEGMPRILLLESEDLTLRMVFTEYSSELMQPEKWELCAARK
ncbi:outer membrane lipoprotein LolB [Kingella negevensis]|uniref:Outer-membrane lipoprotein LolB n=1 Tax=Kingella negevensis TaxID=1522312 RepID=A0A238TBH9_9NEIS|nr:outer membrane lipoprotein LolB [Kingella negevensis]MDK4696806.1 outer membrane lipoprotein LolB [Kingella negevensis]WII94104.1 outer membrane lipoprotein LolB [Kingella negevensis]SNB73490.1 Outer-membrane lipoprotein LolB precursor [Kingella negevensis]